MCVRRTLSLACAATVTVAASAAPQGNGARLTGEFAQAAANGRLANEAFVRSDRLMMDWLTVADPRTGLLPRMVMGPDRDIWNAKDCAADLYPFLVLTAWFTRPGLYDGRMHEILLTETALTARIGRLPDTYSFSKQGFAEARIDTASIMFGGSEYVKDGLMPITELLGAAPWRARMLNVVDDLWRYAPVETPHGRIVSLDPEGERGHAARAVAPLLDDARRAAISSTRRDWATTTCSVGITRRATSRRCVCGITATRSSRVSRSCTRPC
jgi:hypothetical protein